MGSRGTFLVLNENPCAEVVQSVIGIFHEALNSKKELSTRYPLFADEMEKWVAEGYFSF